MNITSLQHAKFNDGIVDTHIYFSKMDASFTQPFKTLYENPLTGQRFLKTKVHKSEITFFVHIFKEANVQSKFNNYHFYEGKDVLLYPWADGNPLTNELGKAVQFSITHCQGFFLNSGGFEDVCLMTFSSKENTVMSYIERFGYGVKYSTQYGERL
jgi:hypothetical protein